MILNQIHIIMIYYFDQINELKKYMKLCFDMSKLISDNVLLIKTIQSYSVFYLKTHYKKNKKFI